MAHLEKMMTFGNPSRTNCPSIKKDSISKTRMSVVMENAHTGFY